jgi:hypothetical protein
MDTEHPLQLTIDHLLRARPQYTDVDPEDASSALEMGNNADEAELEAADSISNPLGLRTIPADVLTLWRNYGEVRLFHDLTYGQWGLTLWPASIAFDRTRELKALFPDCSDRMT